MCPHLYRHLLLRTQSSPFMGHPRGGAACAGSAPHKVSAVTCPGAFWGTPPPLTAHLGHAAPCCQSASSPDVLAVGALS